MSTDTVKLVKQSKSGDADAFTELYSMYALEMYRFAVYMVGTGDDAQDMVQEAVFSAWKSIPGLENEESFKCWLFKILSNKCKGFLKKKSKIPSALPVEDYDFLTESSPADIVTTAELKEALDSLTPPDAQIIILSVITGLKSHEIGEIFGMPAATVRSRQARAYEKLREILK